MWHMCQLTEVDLALPVIFIQANYCKFKPAFFNPIQNLQSMLNKDHCLPCVNYK